MLQSSRVTLMATLTGLGLLFLPTADAPAAPLDLSRLPPSLAQWYKPNHKRQAWLHTMFALRREMQAFTEYATQQDQRHLQKWSARFAGHYRSITEMVPEWEDETDPAALQDLEAAAAKADFSGVLRAGKRISRSCDSCHHEYRALAALRFRSPDFTPVQGPDGAEYPTLMQELSKQLNRVKIAAEDDRWDTAESALAALQDQLDALGSTCDACHQDPTSRQRIFGPSTVEQTEPLREYIRAKRLPELNRRLGEAAVNICARCHSIHRSLTDLKQVLFPTH